MEYGQEDAFVVPLLSHETVRRRRRSLLGFSHQREEEEQAAHPERPHFSRHDPRFLKLPPAVQIAGLYQGYGTVRRFTIILEIFVAVSHIDSTDRITRIFGAEVLVPNDKQLL